MQNLSEEPRPTWLSENDEGSIFDQNVPLSMNSVVLGNDRKYSLKTISGDVKLLGNGMDFVIVGIYPIEPRGVYRSFWESENIVPGVLPVCTSINGASPTPESAAPQSTTCGACPHSVLGTAKTGRGTRCRSHKVIIGVFPETPEDMFLWRVPIMGLKPLNAYRQQLHMFGILLAVSVTHAGVDETPGLLYPRPTFTWKSHTSEEVYRIVSKMAKNASTSNDLRIAYIPENVENSEEGDTTPMQPPVAQRPTPTPVAQRPTPTPVAQRPTPVQPPVAQPTGTEDMYDRQNTSANLVNILEKVYELPTKTQIVEYMRQLPPKQSASLRSSQVTVDRIKTIIALFGDLDAVENIKGMASTAKSLKKEAVKITDGLGQAFKQKLESITGFINYERDAKGYPVFGKGGVLKELRPGSVSQLTATQSIDDVMAHILNGSGTAPEESYPTVINTQEDSEDSEDAIPF